MSRLLLVCLSAFVFCLVSCTDKDKIPKGVLPKEKMQKVLWDMIQAERFRETFIKDSSQDLKAETFKLYAQVFEIHKVTKDEFVKSYKFYMSRPDIARDMFDSLATQANRRREELYKAKPLDTAQVKQPPVDTAKTVQPQPLQPVLPPVPNPNIRSKKLPLRKLKSDTLLKLRQ
ncbi:DUF4296 domain-containing protein [Niastella caeni]|uniref:DUF4296 domain-containing protein n=1 Tax=Niastella caeni TaxID=2569763 RepID=A0A4S8HGU8_9BACT|nr:DUF4296 domain-containing protein [Niastella caeni]THU31972.1 DUF4296 domain-containing protein [Niastella caeni]